MTVWNPRANEIFASVLELPPQEQQAYLERACGADDPLRRQVEALLAAHAEAGTFLDRPVRGAVFAGQLMPVPDSGTPLPGVAGVVRALAGSLPCVQLRQLDGEMGVSASALAAAEAGRADLPQRYRMQGEIARGGMGAIFQGRDTDLGRDVAVKMLLETHL